MVICNAAAFPPKRTNLLQTDAATLQHVLNVNLIGSLLCAKAAANRMMAQKECAYNGTKGHIVFTAGAGTDERTTEGWLSYGASKVRALFVVSSLL